jgi:hypothetical protein
MPTARISIPATGRITMTVNEFDSSTNTIDLAPYAQTLLAWGSPADSSPADSSPGGGYVLGTIEVDGDVRFFLDSRRLSAGVALERIAGGVVAAVSASLRNSELHNDRSAG